MDFLFFGLSLVCLLMFLLGLINPKWVLRWGKEKTRKKVGIYYGTAFFIFFILLAISIPTDEQENKTVDNEYSEKAVFSSDMTEDEFFSLLKKDDLYNECIEISDRVSKYKRNKKWIIETTEYLLEKCDKWDMKTYGLRTQLHNFQIMNDSYNYSNEMHKMYEVRFKRLGEDLICKINLIILEKNLYKISNFLPIDENELFDVLDQNNFNYIKEIKNGSWSKIVEKKYCRSEENADPNFRVITDKSTGKIISISIPLGSYYVNWDNYEKKEYHFQNIKNATTSPYNYSMRVIGLISDKKLKTFLSDQIKRVSNFNLKEFEEIYDEESKYVQTKFSFNEYQAYIFYWLCNANLILGTSEKANLDTLFWELRDKYIWRL